MKFTVLDARVDAHADADADAHAHYTYLDDLLDKTFLTDYFLDRTTPAAAVASASASVP